MDPEPSILCFQHCRKNAKVFCFQLPDQCGFCQADLQQTELRIPPFRVPSPFSSARKMPVALVIKPTEGDFLHDYQNSSSLHIGITDSKGNVYDYDVDGITISDGNEWTQCLALGIIKQSDDTWKNCWDDRLQKICDGSSWTSEDYHKETHNCYNFVLSFLKSLEIIELKPFLDNKTEFCKQFIIPRTGVAAKYIALYRELQIQGHVQRLV